MVQQSWSNLARQPLMKSHAERLIKGAEDCSASLLDGDGEREKRRKNPLGENLKKTTHSKGCRKRRPRYTIRWYERTIKVRAVQKISLGSEKHRESTEKYKKRREVLVTLTATFQQFPGGDAESQATKKKLHSDPTFIKNRQGREGSKKQGIQGSRHRLARKGVKSEPSRTSDR